MKEKSFDRLGHDDHGLSKKQWDYIQTHASLIKIKKGTFVKTVITLPEELGTVSCALYGPDCGDPPMIEGVVYYFYRGGRRGPSRQVHPGVRQFLRESLGMRVTERSIWIVASFGITTRWLRA